jgi:FtsH-binding integral membrane protein
MLGRIILLLIQLAVGWYAAPEIMRYVKVDVGDFRILIYALLFGVIVWILGVLGALVLKDVARPSGSTLAVAVIGALIFAGLTLVPDVTQAVAKVVNGVPDRAYPLLGAVIGYAIKR